VSLLWEQRGTEEHHVSLLWEQKGTHLYIWLNKAHVHSSNREQGNIMFLPLWEKGNIMFLPLWEKREHFSIFPHLFIHIQNRIFSSFSPSYPSTSAQSCSCVITSACTYLSSLKISYIQGPHFLCHVSSETWDHSCICGYIVNQLNDSHVHM
jgi:hypothetical protein